ncbi:acyltransferase family protein [Winogradskyella sp.]|nr:acyltransferase family protein [Winogradskyella sp.]
MNDKKHLPWLDLFRFIAAFEVLAAHTRGFLFVEYNALISESKTTFTAAFFALTRMGSEAVIIFFVLSGFLVGGKSIERLNNGTFRNKDYIIDRMVRIILPLIPALLLTIICEFIASKSVSLIELVGNLFSLQGILVKPLSGNAPLWSLSYEFWFYLLLFFVGGMLLSKVKNWVWFLGIVLVLIVFTVLNAAYLFCWIIGAAVYLYKSKKKSNLFFFIWYSRFFRLTLFNTNFTR